MSEKSKQSSNKKAKKIFSKLEDIADRIMLIFFLLLLGLGVYALVDTIHVFYNASEKPFLQYKPTDGNDDKIIKGSVAWLTIDDTNIDYPVMQGADDSEYLNKNPLGKFSLSGSLFLDYRNSPDFSDPYSLVFGHHMERKTMFGALDDYFNKDFMVSHENGTLIVTGGGTHKLHVFACITADATDDELFNPENITHDELMKDITDKKDCVINEKVDTKGKKILAMSTCKNNKSDNRTIVFATIDDAEGDK